MSFSELLAKTNCPFAPTARIVLLPELTAQSLPDGLWKTAWLIDHTLVACDQQESPDMVVVPVQGASLCRDLASCASFLHTLLAAIYLAAGQPLSYLYKDIDSPSWNFVISRIIPTFVLVFAPFYHKRHIRYSNTSSVAYVCFQPDSSFERHGISGKLEKRRELSEEVRRSFESSGVDYYAELTQNSPKSYRFIKPLQPSDPPVIWWSSPLLLDIGGEPTPTPSPQWGM